MKPPSDEDAARAPRVVLMASGRGSTVTAIADAVQASRCHVELVGVICDRRRAAVIERAKGLGLPVTLQVLERGQDRAMWDRELADAIQAMSPDLVVLAGFMRILGPAVVSRFAGRVVNVHPSLLPAFPGRDAPGQAINAGVAVSGCTVHVVDAGVDSGTILGQAAVPVRSGDDADRLHARIQRAERWLYPAVIEAYANGHRTLPDAPAQLEGDPALFALSTFGT